jgi:hypothetical protein
MRCDELEGIFDGGVSSGRVTTPLSIAGKLRKKVRKVTQNFNGRGNLLQVSKL